MGEDEDSVLDVSQTSGKTAEFLTTATRSDSDSPYEMGPEGRTLERESDRCHFGYA